MTVEEHQRLIITVSLIPIFLIGIALLQLFRIRRVRSQLRITRKRAVRFGVIFCSILLVFAWTLLGKEFFLDAFQEEPVVSLACILTLAAGIYIGWVRKADLLEEKLRGDSADVFGALLSLSLAAYFAYLSIMVLIKRAH